MDMEIDESGKDVHARRIDFMLGIEGGPVAVEITLLDLLDLRYPTSR